MSEPVPLALHASKQQRDLPSTLAAETHRAASPLKLPKKLLRLPLHTFGVEIWPCASITAGGRFYVQQIRLKNIVGITVLPTSPIA
jgi:hypothetical protein